MSKTAPVDATADSYSIARQRTFLRTAGILRAPVASIADWSHAGETPAVLYEPAFVVSGSMSKTVPVDATVDSYSIARQMTFLGTAGILPAHAASVADWPYAGETLAVVHEPAFRVAGSRPTTMLDFESADNSLPPLLPDGPSATLVDNEGPARRRPVNRIAH